MAITGSAGLRPGLPRPRWYLPRSRTGGCFVLLPVAMGAVADLAALSRLDSSFGARHSGLAGPHG
ncbi:MAG: hypothetical protein WKG07_26685 [Hymenobacter sp.]